MKPGSQSGTYLSKRVRKTPAFPPLLLRLTQSTTNKQGKLIAFREGKNYVWLKTQKSLFLPYIWYGKAFLLLLKKGMYQPGLGFKFALTEKLGRCKEY